ncbi:MAG: sensor histidine kinase [Clostridia bacterium]|nr:sensor histidine kinase [Clostridia bacterium]
MKKVPLQRRFIALFAGIFIAVVVVMLGVVYLVVDRLMEKNIRDWVEVRQTETDNGVHLIFNEINVAYARFVFHEDFARLVSDEITAENREKIFKQIVSSTAMADTFIDIAMVHDGIVYSGYSGISFSNSFLEEVSTAQTLVTQSNLMYVGDRVCLPVGKRLTLYPVPETTGCLIFLVDCNSLSERCASLEDIGSSLIVRDDGYVVADSQLEYVGSKFMNVQANIDLSTKSYTVSKQGSKRLILVVDDMQTVNSDYNLKWNVISILEYDVLFRFMKSLNGYIVIIGFCALAGGVVLAWFAARWLSRPIKEFSQEIGALKQVGEGGGIEEFEMLYAAYDKMLERIDELLISSHKEEEAKRKLELDSLQMQINPHFLYNTLDAISWMAKINKQTEIDKMVMGLATLFRISLHNGDKFITIREEMELVKSYLQIQEIRFPSKFVFEENFSDQVGEEYTLKLLLQPIVENCVKHAIIGQNKVVKISVSARVENQDVLFEVVDNGAGFTVNTDSQENAFSNHQKGGYGLKNVNERIRLEYGEGYGLQIKSAPHEGTRVTIRIKRKITNF